MVRKRLRVATQEVTCCHARGCMLSRKRLRVVTQEVTRRRLQEVDQVMQTTPTTTFISTEKKNHFQKRWNYLLTLFCYFKYEIMAKTFLISINCFTGRLAIIPSNLVKPSSPSIGRPSKVIESLPFAAVHRLGFSKILSF